MSDEKLRVWDTSKQLKTPDDILYYLEACFEEAGDDPAFITEALAKVADSPGMTELSKATGTDRESLGRAFSGTGNPSFGTILKVVKELGIKLYFEPAAHSSKSA